MKIRNVTEAELLKALKKVNAKFDQNVIFNNIRCDTQNGKTWTVTLRVTSSKKAGHRIGFSGRRLINACWHVHGTFFNALPEQSLIKTGNKTKQPGDDWEDWNIGSEMQPLMFSDACECN